MFFSRKNLLKTLRGKKTQTRRLSGNYHVGRTYGIRTWIFEKSLGRIKITAKRQEPLGDISPEDLHREGYASLDEFKEDWEGFYAKKMGWHPELIVWVYDYVLVEAPVGQKLPKGAKTPEEIIEKVKRRWRLPRPHAPKETPTGQKVARCLECDTDFYDTEHARTTGVWCPHVSLVFQDGFYKIERGDPRMVEFYTKEGVDI